MPIVRWQNEAMQEIFFNLFPQDNMLFPQDNMLFPQDNIVYPQDNILYPEDNIVYPQDSASWKIYKVYKQLLLLSKRNIISSTFDY